MIKNITVAILLLGFSVISKAQEAPTLVVSCSDCSAQDIRNWFLDTIVRTSKDNPEAAHQTIWNRNRVLVFKHDTSDYDAFELTASPISLFSGISESTFDVTKDSASKAEVELARNLLKYNTLLNQRIDSVAQQLSQSFGSAQALNKWLDSKHSKITPSPADAPAGFKRYGDSCLNDPQYLTIKTLHS